MASDLSKLELDEGQFLSLLEQLIGESNFLQNNPPELVPIEDRCANTDNHTVQYTCLHSKTMTLQAKTRLEACTAKMHCVVASANTVACIAGSVCCKPQRADLRTEVGGLSKELMHVPEQLNG